MKKLLSIGMCVLLAISLCAAPVLAETPSYLAASTPEYTTFGSSPFFFANGTPITIAENPDGAGALITWEGGSQVVAANTNVFGGGHDHDGTYESTSITMTGGTVGNLLGGGLHKSSVETSNVVMTGGTVNGAQGGGASSLTHDCGCSNANPWYAGDAQQSPCKVNNANISVSGGSVFLLFGGGEGISCTGNASVSVSGTADVEYVTAGGSNGYTGDAEMNISGGSVLVAQSVNRGTMNSSQIVITGGTVENAYAGGETGDTSVTGSISSIAVRVEGGTVESLTPGKSGGTVITPDAQNTEVTLSYLPGTVTNEDTLKTDFGADAAKVLFTVSFNTNGGSAVESVLVEEGGLVPAPAAPTKDSYTFAGWHKGSADGEAWDFANDTVSGDLVLFAAWNEVVPEEPTPDPEAPATGDQSMLALLGLMACAAAGSIVLAKKKLGE